VTRWALLAAVPLLAIAAVSLVFVLRSPAAPRTTAVVPVSTDAAATWAAGKKRAPGFALHDERGRAVSLAALRGRPVLITFIDPLCRDFCPVEAQRLSDAVRASGSRPAVVSVSVNTAGDAPSVLALDRRKWKLAPSWHWGVGTGAELARVWKRYGIQVIVARKRVAGVNVQQVSHTEASYLIDANGWQRALFLWPYSAKAVSKALDGLAASP
jgi:cytochrome oxidase Cu insertion factor (SCO1/SenC/PrrC family)